MHGCRIYFALTTALFAVLILFACGQSSQHRGHSASVSISSALAQLDAMRTPEGADAKVFAALKDALRAALISKGEGKLVSTPPTGAANTIADFKITPAGGGTADLSWHYRCLGDYNQDGVVGVADITPLAMHFHETWTTGGENALAAVVDGSGNHEVDISDVTPIAMNFGVEAARYGIMSSDAEDGTYSNVQVVPITDGLDKDTARMRFQVNITPTPDWWYYVVPADGPGNSGARSNVVQASAVGLAPVAFIVPDSTSGSIPFAVHFDAGGSYDPDGTIVDYQWDWESDGTYDLDSGAVPSTDFTYTSVGLFDATVLVTDNDGLTDTETVTIKANAAGNISPVASIVPDGTIGAAPFTVSFDASGSYDTDGTIVKYEWDWEGDGIYDSDTGLVPNASHAYEMPGIYYPTVLVTDDGSANNAAGTAVTVNAPSPWVHTWGGAYADSMTDVAFDGSGNYYVVGQTFYGSGPGSTTDSLVLKYSADGSLQWQKAWGGSGDDTAFAAAVDTGGNVYVVGITRSFGSVYDQAFLLKYDSSGNLLSWTTYSGTLHHDFTDIDVDSSGAIYITGGTQSFGAGGTDVIVQKMDSFGTILWEKAYGGTLNESCWELQLDSVGNIYLAGDTKSFGASEGDSLLLKLDTSGNMLWQKTWGTPYLDAGSGLALDGYGNVYITGYTIGFGPGDEDAFLLKYNTDGSLLWQALWYGTGRDYAVTCGCDADGNIYVTGYTDSFSAPSYDIFLLKYNLVGALISQRTWSISSVWTTSRGVSFDNNGMLVLCGAAMDTSGTWADVSGTSIHVGGTEGDSVLTINDVTATVATPAGTETSPSGVIDTGGGGWDALTMRLDPAAI
jgi:PKD repeat protein